MNTTINSIALSLSSPKVRNNTFNNKDKKKQAGVALIAILLIVAVVAALATQMHWEQRVHLRRMDNIITVQQARQFASGGKNWAREILLQDMRDNTIDNLDEAWATPMPPLPIDGGAIQGQLMDLNARFNINNLIDKEGKIIPETLEQFQRLLQSLEISPDLASAVADWIDADNYPEFPGGAEDASYTSLPQPYRTANHFIVDTSELMSIKGFNRKTYNQLRPHICTLPIDTAININTASAEVLLSISDKLTEGNISDLVEQREISPFENITEFYTLTNLDPDKISILIDTQSEYFIAEIEVLLLERLYRRHTYLFRDFQTGSVSAYQRVHNPTTLINLNKNSNTNNEQTNINQSQL